MNVQPDAAALRELAEQVAAGTLRLRVGERVPLDAARRALALVADGALRVRVHDAFALADAAAAHRAVEARATTGKVVLRP